MLGSAFHPTSARLETANFGSVDLTVTGDLLDCSATWHALEAKAPATLYQRYDWVEAWLETIGSTTDFIPHFVVARSENGPLFLLPLGQHRLGPVTVTEWLADSHFNMQTGLFSRRFVEETDAQTTQRLLDTIGTNLVGADLLDLHCQPSALPKTSNPLSELGGHKSINPVFALNLSGGFDATLDRINGPKRRKKYRWQLNRLGDETRVSLRVASCKEDVARILSAAFGQIARRFSKLGITNVFADSATRSFFKKLALESLGSEQPLLRLYALEIDGKIRATLAGGAAGEHFSACFISLSEDEFTPLSPGTMLIYRVIEDCATRGFTFLDFGRGDEPYKRSWSDQTIEMIDITRSYSAPGKSLAMLQRGKSEAKRLIRNNESLWKLTKQVRAQLKRTG